MSAMYWEKATQRTVISGEGWAVNEPALHDHCRTIAHETSLHGRCREHRSATQQRRRAQDKLYDWREWPRGADAGTLLRKV
jgi:hypothetical protein